MKGVSSVIAIILILMIVIALAALAYTWFSGVFAGLTGTAGTAVTQTTGAMATQFKIENAKYFGSGGWLINATIRNTGTQSFDPGKASVYINGAYTTYLGAYPSVDLASGATAVIANITNATSMGNIPACGATLTITIATGLSDSRVISC